MKMSRTRGLSPIVPMHGWMPSSLGRSASARLRTTTTHLPQSRFSASTPLGLLLNRRPALHNQSRHFSAPASVPPQVGTHSKRDLFLFIYFYLLLLLHYRAGRERGLRSHRRGSLHRDAEAGPALGSGGAGHSGLSPLHRCSSPHSPRVLASTRTPAPFTCPFCRQCACRVACVRVVSCRVCLRVVARFGGLQPSQSMEEVSVQVTGTSARHSAGRTV
jgi:hypothetical protein